jgi:hypothetical protein
MLVALKLTDVQFGADNQLYFSNKNISTYVADILIHNIYSYINIIRICTEPKSK